MIRTKGSLCSGIGGLDEAAPGELSWYAETDKAAEFVMKREYPGVPNLGDITSSCFAGSAVDLLTSGDPCQSISEAGRGLAAEDERFLWFDVMRIIDRVRPGHLFLENVQRLVSAPLVKGGERGGVLKLRLDNLREAGYAVRWTVLGACSVGAPHHRHRWFLRARYAGSGAPVAERVITACGSPKPRSLLPTPIVGDATGGHSEPQVGGIRPSGAKRMDSLNTVVRHLSAQDWGPYALPIARWARIIGRPAPEPTCAGARPGASPRLNAALSEWLMGLPEGFLTHYLSRQDAIRCAGNAVVTLAARTAWNLLDTLQSRR